MRRLASPGWLLKHAIVLVLVTAFLVLGWWQLGRAKQGNALSLGYTFEWPFFAAFVIFMWVREMRITLRGGPTGGRSGASRTAGSEPDATERATAGAAAHRTGEGVSAADQSRTRRATGDEPAGVTSFDLDAALARRAGEQRAGAGVDESSDYNQYLAWLAAHPETRPHDYRPHERRPSGAGPAPAMSPTPASSEEKAHG